ncbi:MAG: hypothetical protein M3O86_05390 [Actinomycetota bacterium]|nr:hypothetical protein [Actinomycetota bacterium]
MAGADDGGDDRLAGTLLDDEHVGVILHELATPLTSITGLAWLLERHGEELTAAERAAPADRGAVAGGGHGWNAPTTTRRPATGWDWRSCAPWSTAAAVR